MATRLQKNTLSVLLRNCIRHWASSPLGDRLGKLPGLPQLRPKLRRFLASHFHPDIVDVAGHRMHLDANDTLLLSWYGYYEPTVTQIFKDTLKKGDTVFDIGANIGYYTLLAAKLVGKEGKVIAFEPEPSNFELLRKNVRLNGYTHVTLEPYAVSKETGKIRLFLNDRNKGDHRIYDSGEARKSIEIQTVSLDDYCHDHPGRVDFIKMDIQGAEAAALQGMGGVLKHNPSIKLVSEFWPQGLRRFGVEPETYLQELLAHDFQLHVLREDSPKPEPIEDVRLFIQRSSEKDDSNILCLRKPA